MQQRGRKSVAALTAHAGAVALVERPEPPLDLTPEQSDIWRQVVESLPADWFTPETFPLLSQYCRHAIEARRLAQLIDQEIARDELDVATYGALLKLQRQESGALKVLAASMRIAQQSTRTERQAGTAKGAAKTVKRPWESA